MERFQVGRGGRRTPEGFKFELTGGAACLDLANTLDERPLASRRDNLESFVDLVDWARQSDLLSPVEAKDLARAATERPAAARRALEEMKILRETLFRIFSALARSEQPPSGTLDLLNRALAKAYSRKTLVPARPCFRSIFRSDRTDLGRLVCTVVESAHELLTSASDLERLRLCASDGCDWLFLDRSKNRTRRWCDMRVCGNRDKVRRFYRRTRK